MSNSANLSRGVLHVPRAHESPPGFIQLLKGGSQIGVIPAENGGCSWIRLFRGERGQTQTRWGAITSEKEQDDNQKLWLRATRAALGWDLIHQEIKVTMRTWQGWENGRCVPYYQAARVALLTFEQTQNANADTHSAFVDPPARIPFTRSLDEA